jgi:hypothetical protein
MYLYTLGFVIYLFFCIITFKTYSKKEEMTKKYILFFIYIFYTILAGYVIQLVDYNFLKNNIAEVIMEIAILAFGGGLYLFHYYNTIIKPKDQNYDLSFRGV